MDEEVEYTTAEGFEKLKERLAKLEEKLKELRRCTGLKQKSVA